MVLTLAIFRQLIALKGLRKVFENRQKKSLKVFEFVLVLETTNPVQEMVGSSSGVYCIFAKATNSYVFI
jgi:hypothetical protein